jgi:hypothetical protein
VDSDPVRLFLVLQDRSWTWSPITTRYLARNAWRDFSEGVLWDGQRVIRALIVEAFLLIVAALIAIAHLAPR